MDGLNLFIHSLVGGHLGYFSFGAIMNNVDIWTFMYRFWRVPVFSVLSGTYLGVELLGPMGVLCSAFRGSARPFFKMVALVNIPTSSL